MSDPEKMNQLKEQMQKLLVSAGEKNIVTCANALIILETISQDVQGARVMGMIAEHERKYHSGTGDKAKRGDDGDTVVEPEPQKPDNP